MAALWTCSGVSHRRTMYDARAFCWLTRWRQYPDSAHFCGRQVLVRLGHGVYSSPRHLSSLVAALAAHPAVHWLERTRSDKFRPLNAFARDIVQSDFVGYPALWNHGLTGQGQVGA